MQLRHSGAEQPLRSYHSLPDRIYNLSYAAPTDHLLVSMAHRHVYVYIGAELAAAREGQELQPAQTRESALKFLTRSVACMADGKGGSSLSLLHDEKRCRCHQLG